MPGLDRHVDVIRLIVAVDGVLGDQRLGEVQRLDRHIEQAPGVIATPFHDRYTNAAQLETQRLTIPMGRVGSAEECVGAYLFLASEALSGYIIGQIIEVNEPKQFFDHPQHERTKLFLSQILR